MRIISTFMFSEPHEKELLWLKFSIEHPYIAKWVVVENVFTFQGKSKPAYLDEVLSDERFAPFLSKIHIVRLNRNFNFEYEPGFMLWFKRQVKRRINAVRNQERYEFVPYAEMAAFHCELNQRQAVADYIVKNFDADDLVFPGDTDEVLDLNGGKEQEFHSLLREQGTPLLFFRRVFCYDFDNFTNRDRYSPVIRVRDIKSRKYSLHYFRHIPVQHQKIAETATCFFFEYTFCFTREAILKKLLSFAHVTDIDAYNLDQCLSANIALTAVKRINNAFLENAENFFDREVLSEKNSPQFVREHFSEIRTGIVGEQYVQNREELLKMK